MKETPILMCGEMVRATLEDRKTKTRRIAKNIKDPDMGCDIAPCEIGLTFAGRLGEVSPYGGVGDRLWVKETFAIAYKLKRGEIAPKEDVVYRADLRDRSSPINWKPSIFMRREYSRITLEITGVRVERLQDISEEDAIAEGVRLNSSTHWATEARGAYKTLWESINGKGSWSKNPRVWVIEFKRL